MLTFLCSSPGVGKLANELRATPGTLQTPLSLTEANATSRCYAVRNCPTNVLLTLVYFFVPLSKDDEAQPAYGHAEDDVRA